MSAVIQLRPFQSAVAQAQRVGVTRKQAVQAVVEAQRQGNSGDQVAGRYRSIAMRTRRPDPTPPEAA